MSTFFEPSFYNSYLVSPLTINGSETEVFVNTLKTLTGETIAGVPSYASQGYIIVDPLAQFGTQPEIISYTGLDTSGIGFTGITRGLSSVTTGSVTANKTYHGAGTPVIISWGAQDINDLITYLNSINNGTYTTATTSAAGIVKTTTNTASGVVISTDDTRVPTVGQNSYLASIARYTFNTATDTGSANAYVIAPSPEIVAYATGQIFTFKAVNANTNASTLAVNGLATKAIKKNVSTALASGDIAAGQTVSVMYDGTNFQLLSPITSTPLTTFASGQTSYDLATASGTQNIAHGLGVVPKFSKVTVYFSNATTISLACSTYIGSTQSSIQVVKDTSTGGAANSGLVVLTDSSSSNKQTGVITTDSTNIKIAWTKTGTPTTTAFILWEASV